jgi:4-hydroxybenzoate polyprenyltransferase
MVDREHDLKIGVKSTAILFAENDKIIVALLQLTSLILLILLGWLEDLNWPYFIALLMVAGLFVRQQVQIKNRETTACFKAFLDNNYVGLVIFVGFFLGYL